MKWISLAKCWQSKLLIIVSDTNWRTPKFLNGLKGESKLKIMKHQGVRACSLAHRTLRGRGVCWSFRMGLGKVTSINYSHGLAQNQHRVVVHDWSTFSARMNHGQTQTHKTHHGPDLGEATTFPLIVYFVLLHETHIQMAFCPKTPKWKSRNCQSWDSHNFGAP